MLASPRARALIVVVLLATCLACAALRQLYNRVGLGGRDPEMATMVALLTSGPAEVTPLPTLTAILETSLSDELQIVVKNAGNRVIPPGQAHGLFDSFFGLHVELANSGAQEARIRLAQLQLHDRAGASLPLYSSSSSDTVVSGEIVIPAGGTVGASLTYQVPDGRSPLFFTVAGEGAEPDLLVVRVR